MARAVSTGAETVRWDLSDLYASPTDPALEADLARSLERAKAFEATYKGKVTTLEPAEFTAMMRELERNEEDAAKPEVYAYHGGELGRLEGCHLALVGGLESLGTFQRVGQIGLELGICRRRVKIAEVPADCFGAGRNCFGHGPSG